MNLEGKSKRYGKKEIYKRRERFKKYRKSAKKHKKITNQENRGIKKAFDCRSYPKERVLVRRQSGSYLGRQIRAYA